MNRTVRHTLAKLGQAFQPKRLEGGATQLVFGIKGNKVGKSIIYQRILGSAKKRGQAKRF